MRYVNVIAAAATVMVGFAGSLTAAHALSIPNPLDPAPLPMPVPGLPLDLLPDGATTLQVTFRAAAKADPVVMTLSCDPTGGNHPRAEDACKQLAAASQMGADPFAAPAQDRICTEIYGGPQTAAVQGTWKGMTVTANFSRTDGCEISRWDSIEPVLSPTAPTTMRTAR